MLNNRLQGFTLIELMIVVVIVAILAAVAYPSYRNSVIKSRRADAQGTLMGFANAMERHFTENNTYLDAGTTDIDANGIGDTGAPTIFPAQSPLSGTASYNLTIQAAGLGVGTYTLRATPVVGSGQDGDGFMELTETGLRRWDQDNDGAIGGGEADWEY